METVRITERHYIYPDDESGHAADGDSDDSFTDIIPVVLWDGVGV